MKSIVKFTVAAAVVAGMSAMFSAAAPAQEKYEFNPHWFLQVQGGVGHTVGETSFTDLLSPAAALNVGYSFSPVFSARIGASGWQGRGYLHTTGVGDYKWNYVQGNLDVMLDLCNLFGKNRFDRFANPYLFAGVGGNYSFNQDDKVTGNVSLFSDPDFVWTDSRFFPAGRVGLGVDLKLSRAVYLNLEANTNVLPNRYNCKSSDNVDWQSNLLVGLTFHFGGKGKKAAAAAAPVAPVVPVAPAPKKEPVKEAEPEAEKPAEAAPVEAFGDMSCNVLFPINRFEISAGEQAKIDELAKAVREAKVPVRVEVSGYADRDTGTDQRNLYLSQKRAEAVRDALVKAGVPAGSIVTKHYGSTVNPFSTPEANRVAVCVAAAEKK